MIEKIIKIMFFPDNEYLGDMGTTYLKSSDEKFIEKIQTIGDDYLQMNRLLDCYEEMYEDMKFVPEHCDIFLSTIKSSTALIEDDSIPFVDKLVGNSPVVLRLKKLHEIDKDIEVLGEKSFDELIEQKYHVECMIKLYITTKGFEIAEKYNEYLTKIKYALSQENLSEKSFDELIERKELYEAEIS